MARFVGAVGRSLRRAGSPGPWRRQFGCSGGDGCGSQICIRNSGSGSLSGWISPFLQGDSRRPGRRRAGRKREGDVLRSAGDRRKCPRLRRVQRGKADRQHVGCPAGRQAGSGSSCWATCTAGAAEEIGLRPIIARRWARPDPDALRVWDDGAHVWPSAVDQFAGVNFRTRLDA